MVSLLVQTDKETLLEYLNISLRNTGIGLFYFLTLWLLLSHCHAKRT